MRKIRLYIATSIDGFIARENGSLDWLVELPNPGKTDHGYDEFIAGTDTVIMGRKTYKDVLGFGIEWPYANCRTYIVTSDRNYNIGTENTFALHELNQDSIAELRLNSTKNIWVVGGGEIITQFLNLDQIDEMTLCIAPVILGKGIKLFPGEPHETKFELVNSTPFETGIVNVTYRRKE
jgi:dihydrofolate reductase